MPTLDVPQGLIDQHAAWHMRNMPGMSNHASDVEFLRFHCSLLGRIQGWLTSQPNYPQLRDETTPWAGIPADLKTAAATAAIERRFPGEGGWMPWMEALEQRLSNQPTTFASDDDLAGAISSSGFHGWVHYAVSAVYDDDNMWDAMVSPRSTYFSQWHGLINNWWQNWKRVSEPSGCASLRSQIANLQGQVDDLASELVGLDPKHDGPLIRRINAQIAPLRTQISQLQQQMASLGCATSGCVPLRGPTERSVAVDTTVTVRESDHDVDTGVDARAGDLLFVEADGQIWAGVVLTFGNWPKGWDNFDTDPKFPYHAADAHPYSLIGKLGAASPYFSIGALIGPWQPLGAGAQPQRLFLRTNDDTPGNGSGAFTCHVIIWR